MWNELLNTIQKSVQAPTTEARVLTPEEKRAQLLSMQDAAKGLEPKPLNVYIEMLKKTK